MDRCLTNRLYPPRGAPVAGTEHGEERVGQGAEHQLGEAVARSALLPHRERLQCPGAAQLGQEPLHGGFTCGAKPRMDGGNVPPRKRGTRVPKGEIHAGSRRPGAEVVGEPGY